MKKDKSNGESKPIDDNNDEKEFNLNTKGNTTMQLLIHGYEGRKMSTNDTQ